MKHIFILFAVIFCVRTQANDNFLFHSTSCPEIHSDEFRTKVINPKQMKLKLKIAWQPEREEPYAVVVPDAFVIASIQVLEILNKEHLGSYTPEYVELYNIGENLPKPFSSFTALLCKSLQSPGKMRLIVNDAFLYHAITFRKKLSHELFHYISQQQKKNYPHWLEEGLAIQFETKITGIENLEYASFHLENSPWMPLVPSSPLKTKEDKKSFYGHSYLFVRYLARQNPDDFFLHILENASSEPKEIFQNLKNDFKAFSLAKYINRFDYFGATLEERERYIIVEDANVDRRSSARIMGQLMSTTTNIQGDSYWIEFDDTISISTHKKPNSTQIFIRY